MIGPPAAVSSRFAQTLLLYSGERCRSGSHLRFARPTASYALSAEALAVGPGRVQTGARGAERNRHEIDTKSTLMTLLTDLEGFVQLPPARARVGADAMAHADSGRKFFAFQY